MYFDVAFKFWQEIYFGWRDPVGVLGSVEKVLQSIAKVGFIDVFCQFLDLFGVTRLCNY